MQQPKLHFESKTEQFNSREKHALEVVFVGCIRQNPLLLFEKYYSTIVVLVPHLKGSWNHIY